MAKTNNVYILPQDNRTKTAILTTAKASRANLTDAVKVADGSGRARMVILAAALRAIGIESEALAQLEHSPVLGHGQPVGALVATGF